MHAIPLGTMPARHPVRGLPAGRPTGAIPADSGRVRVTRLRLAELRLAELRRPELMLTLRAVAGTAAALAVLTSAVQRLRAGVTDRAGLDYRTGPTVVEARARVEAAGSETWLMQRAADFRAAQSGWVEARIGAAELLGATGL
jgi:hypothetical protein